MVLLVGVGLVIRSLLGLYGNTDGFVPDRLLETGSDAGREFGPAVTRWRAALDRVGTIAGVESAAVSSRPPLHGSRQQTFRARRFVVRLLGGFAALALLLAGVGLYGVMAYFGAERRREIAVRVSLGATRSPVLKQVLGEAGRLLAIGLVTGAVAAQFPTRLSSSLLFGVAATDVPTHLVVFAVLGMVTMPASYLPARRAAGIDPIAALKE